MNDFRFLFGRLRIIGRPGFRLCFVKLCLLSLLLIFLALLRGSTPHVVCLGLLWLFGSFRRHSVILESKAVVRRIASRFGRFWKYLRLGVSGFGFIISRCSFWFHFLRFLPLFLVFLAFLCWSSPCVIRCNIWLDSLRNNRLFVDGIG